MPAFHYPARIDEAAPGEFIVTFRDVPEAITGAATYAEAYELAIDALSVAIEGYLDEERALPEASPPEPGEEVIIMTPAVVARVALAVTMQDQGVTRRALAERMGKDEKQVRRILSGEASLDQAVAAMRALGLRADLRYSVPEPA